MTKLEVIKANKALYTKVVDEISKMPEGLAKAVKEHLILRWIKGNNWLGGLSDTEANKAYSKLIELGYEDIDEIEGEYITQMGAYV